MQSLSEYQVDPPLPCGSAAIPEAGFTANRVEHGKTLTRIAFMRPHDVHKAPGLDVIAADVLLIRPFRQVPSSTSTAVLA
jgi:hypothetical protein